MCATFEESANTSPSTTSSKKRGSPSSSSSTSTAVRSPLQSKAVNKKDGAEVTGSPMDVKKPSKKKPKEKKVSYGILTFIVIFESITFNVRVSLKSMSQCTALDRMPSW